MTRSVSFAYMIIIIEDEEVLLSLVDEVELNDAERTLKELLTRP
jgi:hypothetical protein